MGAWVTNFFTADFHLGHKRICELANRPFESVEKMNEEIIKRYNEVVKPEDTCYFLGDVCLGPIFESLQLLSKLNGIKHLAALGNHDRPSKLYHHKTEEKRQMFCDEYNKYFESIHEELVININNKPSLLTHLPFKNDTYIDHAYENRYVDQQPIDTGEFGLHLHGHSHKQTNIITKTISGIEIDVGVDGNQFYPYSEKEIINIYSKFK